MARNRLSALPDVLERLAARRIDTVQVATDLDEQDRRVEGADLVPRESLHRAEASLAAQPGLHVTREIGTDEPRRLPGPLQVRGDDDVEGGPGQRAGRLVALPPAPVAQRHVDGPGVATQRAPGGLAVAHGRDDGALAHDTLPVSLMISLRRITDE